MILILASPTRCSLTPIRRHADPPIRFSPTPIRALPGGGDARGLLQTCEPDCSRGCRLLDMYNAPFGALQEPWKMPDLRDGPGSGHAPERGIVQTQRVYCPGRASAAD